MGEVWRAKDTRLDREIAIKLLPPHLSGDPAFKLRFEREARVISSLNHPNICTLHDVGETDGVGYLVMEFLDGESLADRLLRGPMPVEQALRVSIEIAAALERAHRGGIVHRDLKPGNIMLTKGGAKLLDFGLAKPSSIVVSGVQPPMISIGATEQRPLTAEGTIVGTFQYMAPEQVEGKEADARTDIFAFGAILYEMLTGKRAFDGKTKASLIASILDRQPAPISELRPLTPPALERVVRTALEKEPEDRWQTAHDLLLELRWIDDAGSKAGVAAPVVARRRNRERLAWSLALVSVIAAVGSGVAFYRATSKPLRSVRTQITSPAGAKLSLLDLDSASLVISPDGSKVVFTAIGQGNIRALWIRPLDSFEARPLSGTDNAYCPFWSPDGRFLAFFADQKLKKIDVAGGPPLKICDIGSNARSGSWNRDDVIVFAPSSTDGIHSVPAGGGKPAPVTKLDGQAGETTHRWVTFLPDQKHFLYLAGAHSAATQSEKHAVYAGSLDGTMRKLILHARSNVAYSSGRLLWIRDGSLVAQEFDPEKLELKGEPGVVASSVRYSTAFFLGAFSVSNDGTLVYGEAASERWPLSWFDRNGKRIAQQADADEWIEISISRDGKRFAAAVADPSIGTTDLWIYDVATGSRSQLTDSPRSEASAVWSPDGTMIAFNRSREVNNWTDLYVKPVDGGGEERLLSGDDSTKFLTSWTPDGKSVMYVRNAKDSALMLAPVDGGEAIPFLASANRKGAAYISPDGRWVCYSQNEAETGRSYVTSFPDHRGRWQIGGGKAVWAFFTRGGRELLYLTRAGDLYAMDVLPDPAAFRTGPSKLLVHWPALLTIPGDVQLDGERILGVDRPADADSAPINVVTNWMTVLDKRAR